MRSGSYILKQNITKTSLGKDAPPFFVHLDMELTERCNNNCVHCCVNLPVKDREAKKRELTTDEIKSILREAASLGCIVVRFTGGEPLLRTDFEELYVFARKLGLKVMIFTNATLLTPRLAAIFGRIPPLEKIEVSVYGMHKNSYEAVTRIPGSFEAAWRGIDLLLNHKIPFVVKSAYLPFNKGETKEFEDWAATVPWMDHKPPFYAVFFDLRYRKDDPQKDESIKKFRLTPDEALKIAIRDRDTYFKNIGKFCSQFMQSAPDNLFFCGAGIRGVCIDAYGYFHLCMALKHPDYAYDLKEGSLKDALVHFFPKIRKTKATNPDYLSRCAQCFIKGLCLQCPAKSWTEHGALDTPVEYLCEDAHAQARYLGLISEHEKAWEVVDWKKRIAELSAGR